jgi:hypothetical protein
MTLSHGNLLAALLSAARFRRKLSLRDAADIMFEKLVFIGFLFGMETETIHPKAKNAVYQGAFSVPNGIRLSLTA